MLSQCGYLTFSLKIYSIFRTLGLVVGRETKFKMSFRDTPLELNKCGHLFTNEEWRPTTKRRQPAPRFHECLGSSGGTESSREPGTTPYQISVKLNFCFLVVNSDQKQTEANGFIYLFSTSYYLTSGNCSVKPA